MNITVTFSATPELLSVLQGFFRALPTPATKASGKTKGDTISKQEDQPVVETESTDQSASSKITIEQVRAAVQKQSQAGKRDSIKKLLGEFKVAKVTELTTDQYSEFLQKVEGL